MAIAAAPAGDKNGNKQFYRGVQGRTAGLILIFYPLYFEWGFRKEKVKG